MTAFPRTSMLGGHLGSRVSALVDGHLDAQVQERLWQHVHVCGPCRGAVEQEGVLRTRLAVWNQAPAAVPSSLHAKLTGAGFEAALRAADEAPTEVERAEVRALAAGRVRLQGVPRIASARGRGVDPLMWGGSAIGIALVGLIGLGAGPVNAPQAERRTAVASVATQQVPFDTRQARIRGPFAASAASVSSGTRSVAAGTSHAMMVP